MVRVSPFRAVTAIGLGIAMSVSVRGILEKRSS